MMLKKNILAISTIAMLLVSGATAYAATPDGAAGPWADTFIVAAQGTMKNGSPVLPDRSTSGLALGPAESTGTPYDAVPSGTFFSLGFGGSLTVGFDNAIMNGAGDDLMIYEITGGTVYPDEKVMIEASPNGTDWVMLSAAATRDASLDLGTLACAQFVRVTDVSDIALFEATADGYDVDAIKALNAREGGCALGMNIEKTVSAPEVFPGEAVIYTYTLTNTGDFALENVSALDDHCALVAYQSGDTNVDGTLDVGETWIYTCTTTLSETTTNTATASAEDQFGNLVSDEDSATVTVKDIGCTLTQGYWKTHSANGPAPEDPIWGGREGDLLGGLSWYDIFRTAPKGGNAWFILAHQYLAATLNADNGAMMPPAVDTAYDSATALLLGHAPTEVLSKSLRAMFLDAARILGGYNEGATEVPHC